VIRLEAGNRLSAIERMKETDIRRSENMDLVREIEARIKELNQKVEAESEREKRIIENVIRFYKAREERGLTTLRPLMAKLKLSEADISNFYDAELKEVDQIRKDAENALQLSSEEIKLFEMNRRAISLIDPCFRGHSQVECIGTAISCACMPPLVLSPPYAKASGTCSPGSHSNDINSRAEATGNGPKGFNTAYVNCWFWFSVPGRTSPTWVDVDTWFMVHGFYVLKPATAMSSANFRLELESTGWQYGYSWASDKYVYDKSGEQMGRIDEPSRHLHFKMPVGADPFDVCVSAKLYASAKAGGSLAVGDFATGAGNVIKVWWVNTWSPVP